jgi:Ca2+-binding EF-hand superfamily protein
MKTFYTSLLFLVPAALFACGGTEADDLIDESAALSLTSEDPDSDGATEDVVGAVELDMDEAASDAEDANVGAEPRAHIDFCDFGALRAEVIERFDDDGDGTLSRAEKRELAEELEGRPRLRHRLLGHAGRRPHLHVWKRIKWAFDVDNDGTLDEAERAELIAAAQARCDARRDRFVEQSDTDADGTISEEELRAGIEARRAEWQSRKADFLATYDTSGDGVLDDAERAAVRADMLTRRGELRAQVLTRFDANGDGQLDATEIAALKAAIRERFLTVGAA